MDSLDHVETELPFKVSSERLKKPATLVYKASCLTNMPWRLLSHILVCSFSLNIHLIYLRNTCVSSLNHVHCSFLLIFLEKKELHMKMPTKVMISLAHK